MSCATPPTPWGASTCLALCSSSVASASSTNMKMRSNLESSAGDMFRLSVMFSDLLYCPPFGLAAATMDARAGRVQTMPALAMLTSCCSIVSRNASCSLCILSNSSTQHTPPWERTSAPAS